MTKVVKLDPPVPMTHLEGRVVLILSPFWHLDAKGGEDDYLGLSMGLFAREVTSLVLL